MKSLFLALLMSLNISLAMSADFSSQQITDSKFYFSKDTSKDSRWVMVNVTKEDRKEQILLPVQNAHVDTIIYLRKGAGVYNVQVSESSAVEKYDGSYYVGQTYKIENVDKRNLNFLLPSEYVQSDNKEIIALAKTITTDATDQFDAIKKIHNYVATNISYDYESYRDGTYAQKPWDALSTLQRSKGVCSGYANLYAALLRAIGIRAKVINGIAKISKSETGDHAWNEVFVNNEWMSVDATWDSTTGRMFKYFNIPEEVFAQNHLKQIETDF